MNDLKLLMVAAAMVFSGRGRTDAQNKILSSPDPKPAVAETSVPPLNFKQLHDSIEALNNKELTHFKINWLPICRQLHQYQRIGSFQKLSKEQLESLWWSLESLRSCKHPDILHQHGKEISRILLSMDVPHLNKLLREILKNQSSQSPVD